MIAGAAEAASLFDYADFVENHALAKHARYLSQTLPRESARFGVDTTGQRVIATADPIARDVLRLALDLVRAAASRPQQQMPPAFALRGSLFVHPQSVRRRLSLVPQSIDADAVRDVVRALSPSPTARVFRSILGQSSVSCWELDWASLRNFAISRDLADAEELELLRRISSDSFFRDRSSDRLTDTEKAESDAAHATYQAAYGAIVRSL